MGLQLSVPSIEESGKKSVWIVSQMRSGSSTMLSMMSATQDENREGGEVFSLFEPCHKGDRYAPRLEKLMREQSSHCADLVEGVSKCNFNDIQKLAKWTSDKTSNDNKPYSKAVAKKMCSKASVVAVKTIEPFALVNATWVLDANPHLKIIELIRDPRGIFSSRQSAANTASMEKSCTLIKENMKAHHPRIKKVLFEQWVKSPKPISKSIYKFLGMHWGEKQDDWVKATFNADCNGNHTEGRHNDCHTDSKKVAKKWKQELGASTKAAFNKNEDCQAIAKNYHFLEYDELDFESEDLIEALAED